MHQTQGITPIYWVALKPIVIQKVKNVLVQKGK